MPIITGLQYMYDYLQKMDKVCISTCGLEPLKYECYSRQEIKELIQVHFLDTYQRPIYEEALNYFPKGDQHERTIW